MQLKPAPSGRVVRPQGEAEDYDWAGGLPRLRVSFTINLQSNYLDYRHDSIQLEAPSREKAGRFPLI